jgi:hypothetical protein
MKRLRHSIAEQGAAVRSDIGKVVVYVRDPTAAKRILGSLGSDERICFVKTSYLPRPVSAGEKLAAPGVPPNR